MRNRLLVLALSCVLFGVVAAPAAHASCAGPVGPLKKRLTSYDTVFVGTVTDTASGGRLATVKVESVWRGEVTPTATVAGGELAAGVASSVDRSYSDGVRYLFTPTGFEQGRYLDNACTATQEWTRKVERLRPRGATPVQNDEARNVVAPGTPAPSQGPDGPQAAPEGEPAGAPGTPTPTVLLVGAAVAAAAVGALLLARALRARPR